MSDETDSWALRVRRLRETLGREPTLQELLDAGRGYRMTEAEMQAQRESWVRGMGPCEHGVLDFEDCEECRAAARRRIAARESDGGGT